MSYKFILPYVISTAALSMVPVSNAKSQTNATDNNTGKDKIVNVTDSANAMASDTVPVVSFFPVQVQQQGKSVVYVYNDGRRVVRRDGSRAWRNNNPGNLRYYDFAKRNGAIGEAGNFAVFPDEETGMRALYKLLQTDSYKNLTIAKALKRYDRYNWRRYTQNLTRLTGLSANTVLRNLSQKQLDDVAKTIRKIEGWTAGHEHKIDASPYAMVANARQRVR